MVRIRAIMPTMSTTHHHVLGNCNSLDQFGYVKFMGKNTIGYYWVMCPRVAEVGSLFPGVRCLDLGKLSTKSAQD